MSDYGHHPNEIIPTLKAIKEKYKEKELIVFFQPHQYSRTLELLDDFVDAFKDADALIIPDIYESRDSEEVKSQINHRILLEKINLDNRKFD
jgi:UDP-N-acetylmuramate--alanine ligase